MLIVLKINNRRKLKRYQFQTTSTPLFVGSMVLVSGLIMSVFWILATYKGIPNTAIIVAIVLFIYNFELNRTRLERYIYGIGGNPEAAQLSGINVTLITMFVFMSMSMLAALWGMLYTSRLASATPTAGLGFEMEAIASSYIGGVSVAGELERLPIPLLVL